MLCNHNPNITLSYVNVSQTLFNFKFSLLYALGLCFLLVMVDLLKLYY
jgi:hypothetical protein